MVRTFPKFAAATIVTVALVALLVACSRRPPQRTVAEAPRPDSGRRCGRAADPLRAGAGGPERRDRPAPGDRDTSVVVNAVMLIERMGKDAAAPAIPALVQALKIDGARQRAEYAIRSFGDAAVDPLVKALDSGDAILVKRAAAVLAGGLGKAAKPAIPGLVRLLQTGDDTDKINAMGALASIGSAAEPTLPEIQKAGDASSNAEVKRAAKNATKRIEDAKKPGMLTESR